MVVQDGRDYPVNLIFLAGEGDPIWDDLAGVVVAGQEYSGGQFEVIRGEGANGQLLGNLAFDVSVGDGGFAFESAELFYEGRPEPVEVSVGSWRFDRAPAREFASSEAGAEVASMAGCTSADLPLPGGVSAINGFDTGSSEVRALSAEVLPDRSALSITLECGEKADFYVISPTVVVSTQDGDAQLRFAPIAIGFQDIDDSDLRRIQER